MIFISGMRLKSVKKIRYLLLGLFVVIALTGCSLGQPEIPITDEETDGIAQYCAHMIMKYGAERLYQERLLDKKDFEEAVAEREALLNPTPTNTPTPAPDDQEQQEHPGGSGDKATLSPIDSDRIIKDASGLFDPERFVAEAKKNTKKMYWNGIPVVRKKLPARPEGGRRYLFQGGVVMKIKVGGGKIVAFQNGQVEQFARGGAVSQNDDFDTWLDGSVRVFRNKRNSIRNLIVNVTHINGSGIGPTRVLVWVDAPYLFCKTNSNEQSAIQGEGNAEEGTKMVHAHLSIDLGFLNVSLDEKYFSGYSTTSSPNLFLMDGHVVSTKKTRGNDFYDGKVFYRRTPVSWSTLDSHILHSHKDKLCVYYKPKKKMLFGPEWTSEKNRTTRVTAEFCEYSSQGYGLLLTKKYYTNHASVVDWPEHGEITLVFTEKGDSNHTQFTYSVTSFAGETLFITANELLTSGCQNVRALKLDEVIFNDTLVDNGFVTDDVWYNRYVKYPNYVLYRRQKKDGCETVMRKNTFDLILRKRFRGVLCPPIKVWVKDLHYLDMKNEE